MIEFMKQARITILGTGTSCGVPQLGCNCPTCTSSDPRDKRLRTSVLVEVDDPLAVDGVTRILLDCGPDFRAQMLNAGFRRLDAIFLTHEHYDHVGGIDDIRPFSVFGDMTIYGIRTNVKLLREQSNGEYEIHQLDLTDANLFNSPYYYMEQRDILYVEPNSVMAQNAKVAQTTRLWVRGAAITVSLGSLLYMVLN